MDATAHTQTNRMVLILIPALGALATRLLETFKVREKEALRERGAIELEHLIGVAKLGPLVEADMQHGIQRHQN
jgi:hypothetical protein